MWLSGTRSIDGPVPPGHCTRSGGAPAKLIGGRRWSVLLLCLILAGCSATRIIYNKLDWLLVGYVSDFFTLNDEQKDWLGEAIERNLQWHRRDQLPKYAQFLRELEHDISSDVVTVRKLEHHHTEFIILWDKLILKTMPDISAFFRTLSQPQIEEFIVSLEESNQEMWEEYGGKTPEERRLNRQESAIDGLKRAFGRLSGTQKDLVRSYQADLHDVSVEWIAGRRQWQQDFRDLIVEQPSDPEFSDRLQRLLLEPNHDDGVDYRRRVDENRHTMMSMMAALSAELTARQRKRFSTRLNKYAQNFDILAGQET